MPNPTHLLIDTDALIQIFIARQRDLLVKLRQRCGVTPAVVPEVEGEIRWHPKFKNRFEPQFLMSQSTGTLTVLGPSELRRLLLARGVPSTSVDIQVRAIDQRSQEYHTHVGEGEAYTHAAAVAFGLPVMSNDGAALRTLLAAGKQVACPTLRFFDLLTFGRACDWIDDAIGEVARTHLETSGEHLPPAFRSKDSFGPNWGAFGCRLSANLTIATTPSSADSTLYLQVSP